MGLRLGKPTKHARRRDIHIGRCTSYDDIPWSRIRKRRITSEEVASMFAGVAIDEARAEILRRAFAGEECALDHSFGKAVIHESQGTTRIQTGSFVKASDDDKGQVSQTFLNAVGAILAKDKLVWHDGHRVPWMGTRKPDAVFMGSGVEAFSAVNAETIVEIKSESEFGSDSHRIEAHGFARHVLEYQMWNDKATVLLLTSSKICVMEFERFENAAVRLTDDYLLGFNSDGTPTVGLKIFAHYANLYTSNEKKAPKLEQIDNTTIHVFHQKSNSVVAAASMKADLNQKCIIKHVKRGAWEQFAVERDALQMLRRVPRVVQLLAFDDKPVAPYLLLSPVGEGTLAEHTEKDIPCAEFLGLVDALKAVHEQRWLHRDVRPENLIVTAERTLMLIDFGLAMKLPSDAEKGDGPFVGILGLQPDDTLDALASEGGDPMEGILAWSRGTDLASFVKTFLMYSIMSPMWRSVFSKFSGDFVADNVDDKRRRDTAKVTAKKWREFYETCGVGFAPYARGDLFDYEATKRVIRDFWERGISMV